MKSTMSPLPVGLIALSCLALVSTAQTRALDSAATTRPSSADTFTVQQISGVKQVSVRSKSTLSSFTSVSNGVTGQFRFDPEKPEAFTGRFSMPLTSIHTGIKLRDHHLRNKEWFDAADYPDVVVTFSRAQDVHRESANTLDMTLVGACTMHGVTQNVHIPATLSYSTASPTTDSGQGVAAISIHAQFSFNLSDYHVKGTKTLGMRVEDVQRVTVSIDGGPA